MVDGYLTQSIKIYAFSRSGIGYQINPYFSMGFELIKSLMPITNDINGFNYDNLNDRYQYTAIRLNFDLRTQTTLKESNHYYDEDETDDEPNSPNITPTHKYQC